MQSYFICLILERGHSLTANVEGFAFVWAFIERPAMDKDMLPN